MASPQRPRRSADMARNPNVFDDEYAVPESPGPEIVHVLVPPTGQEPEASVRTRARTLSPAGPGQRRSIVNKETAEHRISQARVWRSSTAKESRPSFEAANGGSARSRAPSNYGEPHSDRHNRPISTASSYAPYEERSSTPAHGRNGSGNGYNQYSQSGLPRASSAGSSYPQRPSIYTPAGPAHPYGLYQQNSIPLEENHEPSPIVQIGFPGRNNSFQRQIGPDGEEQAIVGPDGHTEELPPYSRYPDEDAKVAVASTVPVDSPATASSSHSPIPSNHDSIAREQLPASVARVVSADSPTPSLRSSVVSEKAFKKKNWRERRRTRVCGGRMPLWVLLSVIGGFVLVAVVIGGVIGGLLAADNKGKPPTVTVTSTQSMLDASLIPQPTGIPPVPTGVYMMPLGIPAEQSQNCLTMSDQLGAWTCNTPPQPVTVEIGQPPSGFQILKIHRLPPSESSGETPPRYNLSYGAQAPKVLPMQRLFWVTDLEDPNRGPALHFQTTYDKLVILDSSQFPTGQNNRKREAELPPPPPPPPQDQPPATLTFNALPTNPDAVGHQGGVVQSPSPTTTGLPNKPPGAPPGGFHHRKQALETGDQPWFCYWNQTWIEGFIYVNSGPSINKKGKEPPPETTSPPSQTRLNSREIHPEDPDFAEAHNIYEDAINAHVKRVASASPDPKYSIAPTPSPKPFPYVMKIQERRIPGSAMAVPPYCEKMTIPQDGPPIPINNDDGEPVRINLVENEPSLHDQSTALKSGPSMTPHKRSDISISKPRQFKELFRRQDIPKSCHCLWISPLPPT